MFTSGDKNSTEFSYLTKLPSAFNPRVTNYKLTKEPYLNNMAAEHKLNCDLYVVCNPTVEYRREAMKRRLNNIGVTKQSHIIDGGDQSSELVSYYDGDTYGRGVAACVIGHLRALRAFVDSKQSYGCVLEDDVLFRDDFVERINDYLVKYADQTLIQIFCISGQFDGPCRMGLYGTQGYIISRDYAKLALERYDKPMRYWSNDVFHTSEAIIMYSGGICLSSDPLVIEDRRTHTLNGGDVTELNEMRLRFRHYSYNFGLHRYIKCDDKLRIDAMDMAAIWDRTCREDHVHIRNLLAITEEPKTDREIYFIAMYYMLSYWHMDNELAREWGDRFFRVIMKGELETPIFNRRDMAVEIARFYTPRFPERVKVNVKPDEIGWQHPLNWIKLPNAPYIYELH